ncbi:MAG TPA: helix-turn-helix transcriptional regulator [Thermoanaerobaculia bacterium]|nr:helix-turn-helix transcriptional regulator [Thermoanaerobaculia bacterium]
MSTFQGLHKALRWLRLSHQLKQRDVARSAGITQAMLCSYEQGKRAPSVESLGRVLNALGVDLAELARALALVNREGEARVAPAIDSDLERQRERVLAEVLDGFRRWLLLLDGAIPDVSRRDVGAPRK